MYKKIHMAPMTVQMILKKMNLKFKMKLSPQKTTIMQSQEHWEIGYLFNWVSICVLLGQRKGKIYVKYVLKTEKVNIGVRRL